MNLLEISIQYRVIIGISAMVFLFTSFLIAFVTHQRKKIKYHRNLQDLQKERERDLLEQNVLLEDRVKKRTEEIVHQKENLQNALSELKKSQLQLIQTEKMASLGELTSGVAHEIQNPLNFIINFSESTSDLIADLEEQLENKSIPDTIQVEIIPILKSITSNLGIILNHGKRADNIIKSMLLHSKIRGDRFEPIEINHLMNKCLDLSYEHFQKLDKHFECGLHRNFDENLKWVNLSPENISRVLDNLLNNSFYSIREKKLHKDPGYSPLVSLSTLMKSDQVEIRIWDNGMGIKPDIMNKIYQPFFTTKPTGVGTGLGLSLSYDIIKTHQGNLLVNSMENEFAEFIIQLPLA